MIARVLVAMGTLLIFTQLSGCGTPTDKDVIGLWAGADGAQLSLNADGSFTAQSLSRSFFFDGRPGDNTPVTGKGKWHLDKVSGYWAVRLSLAPMPMYPGGFDTSVLVSGSGGST